MPRSNTSNNNRHRVRGRKQLNAIEELQSLCVGMEQPNIKTTHSFCDGVYAREITIPKDSLIIGAKHKTSFFMVISKGHCIIRSGDKKNEYKAPCTLVSPVGAKRAIIALEDTVITTFHKTNETDVEKIAEQITEKESLKIANNNGEIKCLIL